MMAAAKKGFIGFIFVLMATMLMCMPVSAASSVKLNKTKASVVVGKTVQLKVKNTKKKVKWSSSKKSVATVNSKGLVTAKKAGTTTIKAKVGSKTLKCKVTVKSNSWKTKADVSKVSAWVNTAQCDQSAAIMAYAQAVKVSYNSKGQLVAKVAVLNNTPGRNYQLKTLKMKITKTNGKVIAEGNFTFKNHIINPMCYSYVTLTFNNGGTKQVVNLNNTKFNWSIATN